MQVKCLAQCLAQLRSSTAAHKKAQTLLYPVAFAITCRIPKDLPPTTSRGPGTTDKYTLDPNSNPTKEDVQVSLCLQMGKVQPRNTETLPKASAFQTISPGLVHFIPGILASPSLSHQPPSFPTTWCQEIVPPCCTGIENV